MTTDYYERSVPIKCPSCSTLTTNNLGAHCFDRWCGWVKCHSCEVVINTRTGSFMKPGR